MGSKSGYLLHICLIRWWRASQPSALCIPTLSVFSDRQRTAHSIALVGQMHSLKIQKAMTGGPAQISVLSALESQRLAT